MYSAKQAKEPFEANREISEDEIKIQDKKIKRTLEIRSDPLFGLYSTQISRERAQRGGIFKQPPNYEMTPKEKCIFCKEGGLYKETPEPRRFHRATEPAPGYELISFPNKYNFAVPHWVTIFSDSIDELDLLNLQKGDIFRYLQSACEFAHEFREAGLSGMFDFINWGPEAGASIDHPHAQRGGLVDNMRNAIDVEIDRCREIKRRGVKRANPIEKYLEMIKATKGHKNSLYCFENDVVTVCCPFASRFSDQVDIYHNQEVNNLIRLREEELDPIAEAMIKVLHALGSLDKLPREERDGETIERKRRKVTDLNIALHQARFDDDRDYYRLHWHITPRMSKIGSFESQYDSYVVDVFPETTAADVRELVKGE